MIYGCSFAWFSSNLLVSIIRVISTSPGNIPDDREWDMPSQNEGFSSHDEDTTSLIQKNKDNSVQNKNERFTNSVI
jgi:hypothetical protein